MLKYKLTNKSNQTYNNTQWGENITHTADGKGELCSEGWLHYYDHPVLAVLFNPIHANFKGYNLWECEVAGTIKEDNGLKSGCTSLTTLRQIAIPEITLNQKIAFSILVAKQVCKDEKWLIWADNWLNGKDRSKESAYAAACAVYAANAAASYAEYAASYASYATYVASYAEYAASYATYAASYAEYAASYATYAASYATYAAAAANYAANAAANAAANYAANAGGAKIGLIKLAEECLRYS